jgi:hypothetical protein
MKTSKKLTYYKICRKNLKETTDFEAWTDGSCNNLSPYGEGAAAYVVLKDGVPIHEAKHGYLGTSNNRMELLAIISAVNWIPAKSSLTIYTDSQYAIDVLSGMCGAKKNTDLIRLYNSIVSNLSYIRFVWVKGHDGYEWNEYVDELASSETEKIVAQYNIPTYNFHNSPKIKNRNRYGNKRQPKKHKNTK